jgi:type I restriction enzyme S subunit
MREDCEINYKDAVFKISTTKQKLKQKEYLQTGEIPVIDQGQYIIGGYTNDKNRVLNCELPVVVFGDHTKNVKLIKFPFAPGADGTKVLEPKTYITPSYLYYVTEVLVFKIKDKGYARHYQYIEKENFPLVSVPEQKAIVKRIEELFSSLDSGIADLKKAQDQLVIYRQAVLKKAFEGELTKEWREKQTNLPSAYNLLEQIKEERQKKNEQQLADWKQAVKLWDENKKKPVKPKFIKELTPLTNEELEQLPSLNKYWQWVKADKFASHEGTSLKAGPFGSSLKKEFYTESGYKIYGQEQVISNNHKLGDYYVNQEKYESLINCAIKPFDILISLVGTVGKVLVLPKDCEDGIINPRLVKISLNKFYDSIFFKYYFESAFLKSIYSIKAHGATMDILNLGIIKELPYPLCSKQEQHQIVLEIESRLSVCDKVEESIKESLEKAQALRQSILKKAFEGKLLTKDEIAKCKAQPEYEPAGALLERIKKEKTKK